MSSSEERQKMKKMKMERLLLATLAALVTGTVVATAQNPPGAIEQDRGIREDLGRPAIEVPLRRERRVIVPLEDERGTVGLGTPYSPAVPNPPGGEWQDKGINDDAGKPPSGEE
jgi:hypothetical protein